MGVILTRRRAHGDYNGGGYSGTVDIDIDVDVDWAVQEGFHVTGP